MTPQYITEGNKLIAEFMGFPVLNKGKGDYHEIGIIKDIPIYQGDLYEDGYVIPEELMYHLSWDWLMPVVEKIESIYQEPHGYFGVIIHSNGCTIQGTKFRCNPDDGVYYSNTYRETKIEATFIAVVEFIKWYNKNKII